MKVRISRVDNSLPLPSYQTTGAVAFDLGSRIDDSIPARAAKIIPANIIIEVPDGHALIISARSSLAKKGLMLANGIGVVDMDYHGPKDEIGLFLFNYTDSPVEIKKGDRLAQGFIIPIARAEWKESSEDMKTESRGGFGSTG